MNTMLGQLEVIHKFNQERLEKIRQEVRVHALLKNQQPSLRLRTAKTLERLAYRLSPKLEAQHS
ncbi:MAG: hypothetical protein ACRCYY_12805 [Trueperaceae bacterium]